MAAISSSVPGTLKSLQLSFTAAESKIRTIMACTVNHDALEDELISVTSGCNRPIVAKFLRSDDISCKDDAKAKLETIKLRTQKDVKISEGSSLQRAGSCDLPQKQKMGGFVPAWRRKSLDDINRIKSEKKGELDDLHFECPAY